MRNATAKAKPRPVTMWAIVSPAGHITSGVYFTRAWAQAALVYDLGGPVESQFPNGGRLFARQRTEWQKLQKHGWRVIKVQVVPV